MIGVATIKCNTDSFTFQGQSQGKITPRSGTGWKKQDDGWFCVPGSNACGWDIQYPTS